MKKALIGISALLLMAFVVVLFVNAQNGPQETKKTATEVKSDSKAPAPAACCPSTEAKTAEKAKGCCEPKTATGTTTASTEAKKDCSATCPMAKK